MDALASVENLMVPVDFAVKELVRLRCLVVSIGHRDAAASCCYEVIGKQASLALSLTKNCLFASKQETFWLMASQNSEVC